MTADVTGEMTAYFTGEVVEEVRWFRRF